MIIINLEQNFLYTTSAVKRLEFVSNRVSYIVLRGHLYNIILNVHAPSEGKK
jgi:hypothetical protein